MIAIFPEIVACVREKDIERLALLTRRYFARPAPFKPQIDMRSVIEFAGVQVFHRSMESEAILCVKDEKGRVSAVAFVQADVAQEEVNFLYAHILGHFFLHVQPKLADAEWRTSGLTETVSPFGRYCEGSTRIFHDQPAMEQEADDFAGALLMPKAMLVKAMNRIEGHQALADFFGVPEILLRSRLRASGLVAASQMPVNFDDAEGRLKRQVKEQPAPHTPLYTDGNTKQAGQAHVRAYAASGAKDKNSTEPRRTASATDEAQNARHSLERIRSLARKIDGSVT